MAEQEQKKDFKHIVRIANSDLKGEKKLQSALRGIKGINFMLANFACVTSNIDGKKQVGTLTDDEIKKIDAIIQDPLKSGAPKWMINRRKSPEDGEDKHLLSADLIFTRDNDIKQMRKIKSYRGIRHSSGLPTRGQRTKSNFRRNKGKVSIGVKRKAGAKSGK